jgi:hypothetical protein
MDASESMDLFSEFIFTRLQVQGGIIHSLPEDNQARTPRLDHAQQ